MMLLYSNRVRMLLIIATLILRLALVSLTAYAGDCEGVLIGTCP